MEFSFPLPQFLILLSHNSQHLVPTEHPHSSVDIFPLLKYFLYFKHWGSLHRMGGSLYLLLEWGHFGYIRIHTRRMGLSFASRMSLMYSQPAVKVQVAQAAGMLWHAWQTRQNAFGPSCGWIRLAGCPASPVLPAPWLSSWEPKANIRNQWLLEDWRETDRDREWTRMVLPLSNFAFEFVAQLPKSLASTVVINYK